MADFVLAYGVQPSEYRQLTRLERSAFHDRARRLNDQMRKG